MNRIKKLEERISDLERDLKWATQISIPRPGYETSGFCGTPGAWDHVRIDDVVRRLCAHLGLKLVITPATSAAPTLVPISTEKKSK